MPGQFYPARLDQTAEPNFCRAQAADYSGLFHCCPSEYWFGTGKSHPSALYQAVYLKDADGECQRATSA